MTWPFLPDMDMYSSTGSRNYYINSPRNQVTGTGSVMLNVALSTGHIQCTSARYRHLLDLAQYMTHISLHADKFQYNDTGRQLQDTDSITVNVMRYQVIQTIGLNFCRENLSESSVFSPVCYPSCLNDLICISQRW